MKTSTRIWLTLIVCALCVGYISFWIWIIQTFESFDLFGLGVFVFLVFHAVLLWYLPRTPSPGSDPHDDDEDDAIVISFLTGGS